MIGLMAMICGATACAHPAGKQENNEIVQLAEQIQVRAAPQLVPYKTTPTRVLYLHIFKPDEHRFPGVRPAALIFHGGGWKEGNPQRFYDQGRHLAEKGVVAIAAEYRISSIDHTGPDSALRDANSAMRFVRAKANTWQLDPRRIVAIGGSAGGQLAAALATTKGFDDPADDLAVDTQPAALVLYNPVIDNGPGGYGHDRVMDYWSRFSPLHNIAPGHPPTLILLGTKDELVPAETGELYCQRVRAAGSKCILHLYEGQPHAFYNRGRSELYYRKTLEAMDSFLKALGYF